MFDAPNEIRVFFSVYTNIHLLRNKVITYMTRGVELILKHFKRISPCYSSVVRVSALQSGDRSSNPGRVIPKTLKWYLIRRGALGARAPRVKKRRGRGEREEEGKRRGIKENMSV